MFWLEEPLNQLAGTVVIAGIPRCANDRHRQEFSEHTDIAPLPVHSLPAQSALTWAPAHIFPGVLLGMAISLAGASAEQLTLLIIAGLIVVSAVCWFLPRASVEIARARANRLRPTCFSNPPELQ
jgi:hypothetical protein